MQFLCDLNDRYSHVKSNILMMNPLPVMNKVFSFAVQQERQFNNANALGNLSVVNVASRSNSCTYYGKDYHIEDNCYKNHDYHPNFSSNRGGRGGRGFGRGIFGGRSNNNGKVCTHCGINRHIVKECYIKHGYQPRHKLYET